MNIFKQLTGCFMALCMIFCLSISARADCSEARNDYLFHTCYAERGSLYSNEGNITKGLLYKKYKVIKTVNIRSGPGTSYDVVGTIEQNKIVYVRSISNGWAKIKYLDKVVYLPSDCIQKIK